MTEVLEERVNGSNRMGGEVMLNRVKMIIDVVLVKRNGGEKVLKEMMGVHERFGDVFGFWGK
ncbi:hypothetical protein [Paenibacillus xylanexedens]|uniref:hypothetical protein n=1 Tax=Paenibacillus xylanexedens TaxID=528191 RepID=UPI0011A833F3|nr:hypothetical protein [Paenibacillus xylanexedens]